ncbi:hypothetical protein A8E99_18645 [Burkholderia cenocepacia]|nr:hypothetical protein A8E99_18645 [Burkholderia cenocepacia]ONW42767.1 hypothetical protein A8E93_14375 [Burkholderia cenocepacia]
MVSRRIGSPTPSAAHLARDVAMARGACVWTAIRFVAQPPGWRPGQPKRNDGGTALPHLHPVRTNA